jgi:hypothetical protein
MVSEVERMSELEFRRKVASRSSFVTALAWVFIAMSGFATFVSILQNIMILIFFPGDQMQATINQAEAAGVLPAFGKFMFANFPIFFVFFLVFSTSTLVSSIGLLKRRNWARLMFIVVLVLGILWNIGGVFLQYHLVSSFPAIPEDAPEEFMGRFFVVGRVIMVFGVVMAMGISGLFAWIIKRLSSEMVKKEFGAL